MITRTQPTSAPRAGFRSKPPASALVPGGVEGSRAGSARRARRSRALDTGVSVAASHDEAPEFVRAPHDEWIWEQ
jgi:hypothetical protein